jgi:hypothetical protein
MSLRPRRMCAPSRPTSVEAGDVVDVPRPTARAGPWRTLPRVDLTGVTVLGRWDDAPDRDGDELPDAMLAVHWNSVAPRCTPVNALRSCPRPDPDDTGPEARDGAFTLGYLTQYSGDAADGDAGPPIARVLGTRRVWRASSTPLATLRGVEFTEFGGGVITRAVLEVTDGAGASDVIDVADLFVGAGAERHVGAMVHHCRTPRRGRCRARRLPRALGLLPRAAGVPRGHGPPLLGLRRGARPVGARRRRGLLQRTHGHGHSTTRP